MSAPMPVSYTHLDVYKRQKQIIAVDIPSGINGDTGEAMGIGVRAAKTITFHAVKKGLINCGGYAGEIIVEDIGIPQRN